jgi:N-acetylglutamate synthase/N-acetylornithine aminotransferase
MATGKGQLPTMHPVTGFKLGIASAGIKTPGRKDLLVMEIAEGSTAAGLTDTVMLCSTCLLAQVCAHRWRQCRKQPRSAARRVGRAGCR